MPLMILFHRHALGEVAWAVNVLALADRDVVGVVILARFQWRKD